MRDLLFDPEPWVHVPPRVWGSLLDVPPNTMVAPDGEAPGFLYVTNSGTGWWFDRNVRFWPETEFKRADQYGWALSAAIRELAPFTEVFR